MTNNTDLTATVDGKEVSAEIIMDGDGPKEFKGAKRQADPKVYFYRGGLGLPLVIGVVMAIVLAILSLVVFIITLPFVILFRLLMFFRSVFSRA